MASEAWRSRWTSARASGPVSQNGACEERAAAGGSEMSVDRERRLEGDERSMLGDRESEGVVQPASWSLQQPNLNLDSGGSQAADASSCYCGVRIDGCHDAARDAGRNQCIGAGSGAAVVAAGLQRDVSRRPGCIESRLLQSDDLRVVEAVILMCARADDLAVPHQNASNLGIRRGESNRCFGQIQRLPHECLVFRQEHPGPQRCVPGRSDSHTVSTTNSAAKVHSATVRVS